MAVRSRKVIKPKGRIHMSKAGKAHIPSDISDMMSSRDIGFVSDAKTALLFDPETSASDILKSLNVLKDDLSLRIEVQKKRKIIVRQ